MNINILKNGIQYKVDYTEGKDHGVFFTDTAQDIVKQLPEKISSTYKKDIIIFSRTENNLDNYEIVNQRILEDIGYMMALNYKNSKINTLKKN